jgi:hypothetical protein
MVGMEHALAVEWKSLWSGCLQFQHFFALTVQRRQSESSFIANFFNQPAKVGVLPAFIFVFVLQ